MDHPVVLYDGVCGLCNRFVQFVLRRDRGGTFRFAALQSEAGARLLMERGAAASPMDTMYVVIGSQLLARSEAARFILTELGGIWKLGAHLLRWMPRSAADAAYAWVARHRYGWFGKYDACPVPAEKERERFLG